MARTEIRGTQIVDASVSLAVDVTGTLPVANGGTGNATFTANALLVGAGAAALGNVAPGAAGHVVMSNGTQWASSRPVRFASVASAATQTPNADAHDHILYAVGANLTVANPTGTLYEGQTLVLRFRASGTFTVAWGTTFASTANATLPTSFTGARGYTTGFIYDATSLKWFMHAFSGEYTI